jgi:ABC-2 type transport system ATP-binding protein
MKMLTGFLAADVSGTAQDSWATTSASDALAARRLIGYLPEGAPLYGELTRASASCEFAAGGPRIPRPTRCGQRVHDVSRAAGAGRGLRHQTIETLSKGFKRRVGLAQAILLRSAGADPRRAHRRPGSEPEATGATPDPRHVRRPRSSLISTHILEEVDALCSRAMIIARGKLLADDTPARLLKSSRYATTRSPSRRSMPSNRPQPRNVGRSCPRRGRSKCAAAWSDRFSRPGRGDLFRGVSPTSAESRAGPSSSLQLEPGRLDEVFRSITHRRDKPSKNTQEEAA